MRVALMNEWAGSLPKDDECDFRNVDARALSQIITECRARTVRLYHVTAPSLDGIELLTAVTDLAVNWAPKITSLAPLFRMAGVRRLTLIDLARVWELDGIERLRGLVELDLQGGMWKPLRLKSLRPLAGLPLLERLTILNTRLGDDDVALLASMRRLRALHLSNQFERRQVAHVARALNGQLEQPLAAYLETKTTCERCGNKRLMFTGSRMPILCPSCDSARVTKLTDEFLALVASS
jgi:hypothetical protein